MKTEQRDVFVEKDRRSGFLGWRRETYRATERQAIVVEVVPPHWVLLHTNHWIQESSGRAHQYEYNEQNYWVLTEHGDLLYVWAWEEFRRNQHDSGRFESDITAAMMSADNVLSMDHAHPKYEVRRGKSLYWGNRDPGKLIRHAPGVGLSLALKSLMPIP